MKIDLNNFKGEKIGEVDFPDEIANLKFNPALVHQVMRWYLLNKFYPYAHTKTRGEVRGGGRKPWRQKGTGRARHSSIRSPIWRGGGVTFGPRNEEKKQIRINKKMKTKALLVTLAEKLRKNLIKVVDKTEGSKTKDFDTFFAKFLSPNKKKKRETALLVIENNNANILKAVRNLPYADAMEARNLNLLEILKHKYIFLTTGAIEVIKKNFINNKVRIKKL